MKLNKIFLPFLVGAVLVSQLSLSANPYKRMNWAVGQWASYQIKTDKQDMQVKYSITGSENVDGKTYYWFEMSMDTKGGKTIIKNLMSPDDTTPKRMIMKHGDQQAMEMTGMMQQRGQSQMSKPPIHSDSDINKGTIGVEPITVPAGTYTAIHTKITDKDNNQTTDAWVSSQVPIMGIVKTTSTGDHTSSFTLVKCGTSGATTEITETPQKFDMNSIMNSRRSRQNPSE